MTLARLTDFQPGTTLPANTLDAEIDNIINNPVPLLNFAATNVGSLVYLSGASTLSTLAVPSAGQLLIGTGSGWQVANLTAGANISITTGAGSVEIAASTGGSVTVQESDGSPSVTGVSTIKTDQSTGLTTASGGAGVAVVAIGTVPVANGGTGIGTATSNGVLMGNVTGGFKCSAAGSANQVFRVGTSGTQGQFGAVLLSSSAAVTGTLATTNGGTGLSSTPADGQLLIGNGNNFTLGTLTAGSGITITNGDGSITVAASGSPDMFEPEDTYEFYEDFDVMMRHDVTETDLSLMHFRYPWTSSGGVGVSRVAGNGGIVRVAASTADKCAIIPAASDSQGANILAANNPTFRTRLAPVVNGVSVVNRYLGLTSANFLNGSPANGIYLTWQGSSSHIMAVCRSGSAQSYRDTGITASNGVYHTFRLAVSGGGTGVDVVVDGTSVGSISSNIPSAALFPCAGTSSNDAAAQGMDLDYIHIRSDR